MSPILGVVASSITGKLSTNSYQSIATIYGTGSSNTISFTSVPNTFKHLEARLFVKDSANAGGAINLNFNSDGGSVYSRHRVIGNGSAAQAVGQASGSTIPLLGNAGTPTAANTFAPFVIEIVDYASTNKLKTIRSFTGNDSGTSGGVEYASGQYRSSNAISTITFVITAGNFTTDSFIALYGIKG